MSETSIPVFFKSKLCPGLRTTGKDGDGFSFWENGLSLFKGIVYQDFLGGGRQGQNERNFMVRSCLVEFRSLITVPLLLSVLHSSNPCL